MLVVEDLNRLGEAGTSEPTLDVLRRIAVALHISADAQGPDRRPPDTKRHGLNRPPSQAATSLGRGDIGAGPVGAGVDQPECDGGVDVEGVGAALVVVTVERGDGHVPVGDGRHEEVLGVVTQPGLDQPCGVGEDRGGHDQLVGPVALEQGDAGGVVLIPAVCGSEQHASVDDDHTSRAVLSAKASRMISR